MKRAVTRTLAAVAAVGLAARLAACSTDGGDADGPLTVWIMGDSGANFEQLVTPFTEETGTEVEVVAIPWDAIDERLTTAVASGSGPDLLQIGLSKLSTFAAAGALLPLDDHLGDHPGLAPENFPDGVAEATQVGGETVSVPWVSDTRVLFYGPTSSPRTASTHPRRRGRSCARTPRRSPRAARDSTATTSPSGTARSRSS